MDTEIVPRADMYDGVKINETRQRTLKRLATSGSEVAQMARITALPESAITAYLEATPLAVEFAELADGCNTYADLNEAIIGAREHKALVQGDKASQIYDMLLLRIEKVLTDGDNVSLRSLLEGIRVMSNVKLTGKPLDTRQGGINSSTTNVAVSSVRNVTITMGSAMATKPVLDEKSNIIGIDDGTAVKSLQNMSVTALRTLANGGEVNREDFRRMQSLREQVGLAPQIMETTDDELDRMLDDALDAAMNKELNNA